jgi:hypothetical protein
MIRRLPRWWAVYIGIAVNLTVGGTYLIHHLLGGGR